jgi:hypothetical protein
MSKTIEKLKELEKKGKVRIDRKYGTVEILAKGQESEKIINQFAFLEPKIAYQILKQKTKGK